MCGIVGVTRSDLGVPSLAALESMATAIAHRGPDDDGYLVAEGIGLYHKRLSIIDPECGRQPMAIGPYTIVYNGEIYNYVELREQLIARGHRFVTGSDTEVVLRLYVERGSSFVESLNGMFALLIHDRERNRLVGARDRLGIKPLYYRVAREGVQFASEIKALLRYPGMRPELDEQALHDYLTFQFVLGERTLFRGVRKLAPGHICVVDIPSSRMTLERYWEPQFEIDAGRTEAQFTADLRELLEDAVRIQMRSDVPVGSHLSGGLDSSVVTSLATRHHPAGLDAFHGAFAEGPGFDEREYAREVAAHTGVRLHELVPEAGDFIELMPRLVYHLDEPVAGPGVFPQYMVSRLAASHVKVVLGGQGGDEIFGGYARYLVAYLEQALKGAILETNEEAEHIVSLASILPQLPSLRAYLPMLRQFWSEGAFEPMDRRYFRLIDRSAGESELLHDDVAENLDREAMFERFATIFNRSDTRSYLNKMTHFDLVTSLPALLQVEDRVSMAVSLESRVPLLDHRIVELVCAMPPAMKFRGGELKYVFKRAVKGLVPERVYERKDKMGFPVPLHLWAAGSLREFFSDLLLGATARERGIFNSGRIETLLTDEGAYGRKLWGAVNLELWHRLFLDSPPQTEIAGPEVGPMRRLTDLETAAR